MEYILISPEKFRQANFIHCKSYVFTTILLIFKLEKLIHRFSRSKSLVACKSWLKGSWSNGTGSIPIHSTLFSESSQIWIPSRYFSCSFHRPQKTSFSKSLHNVVRCSINGIMQVTCSIEFAVCLIPKTLSLRCYVSVFEVDVVRYTFLIWHTSFRQLLMDSSLADTIKVGRLTV